MKLYVWKNFKLPKGTEWGNQNRENGLLLVKPPMEELFKNVKVYKNKCKYHDVIFGFLNSWMGEELPESFLVREKEKVKTGYEKKVFEKRKNSIYSLDNTSSERNIKKEKMGNKSKRFYKKMIKVLSLKSSKASTKDINIHILVENVEESKEENPDDDNTLNSNSPLGLEDEYIRMNMHTCNGRIQNVYTGDLLNALKYNGNEDKDDSVETPTPTTTIFNLFDYKKNDFSSETLNELNRPITGIENIEGNQMNEKKNENDSKDINNINKMNNTNDINDISNIKDVKDVNDIKDVKDAKDENTVKEFKSKNYKLYHEESFPPRRHSSYYSSEVSNNSNYLSTDIIFDQNKLEDKDIFSLEEVDKILEKKARDREMEKDKELRKLNEKPLKKSHPHLYREENHLHKRRSTNNSGNSNPNYLS
eukprot:jgi/Orpsp1_1/1188558/evm.model.d7180000065734.1